MKGFVVFHKKVSLNNSVLAAVTKISNTVNRGIKDLKRVVAILDWSVIGLSVVHTACRVPFSQLPVTFSLRLVSAFIVYYSKNCKQLFERIPD